MIVFDEGVVPLANSSTSSVLAVLCHRIWEIGRRGRAQGTLENRALRKARATLDRLAIFRSRWFSSNGFNEEGTFMMLQCDEDIGVKSALQVLQPCGTCCLGILARTREAGCTAYEYREL